MADLGKRNRLPILRETRAGLYLDGGTSGEILLPGRYLPKQWQVGEFLEVFVYRDSEDRLVATTETPFVTAGEFACLEVVDTRRNLGAFLRWGLAKDLLLPIREQSRPVREGDRVVVLVHVDERSDRLVATMRFDRFLDIQRSTYNEGDTVRALIVDRSDLGYNTVVDGAHRGLLYHTNLNASLTIGTTLDAFVRRVRSDGKLDLQLEPPGSTHDRAVSLTDEILQAARQAGGFLPLGDKSNPEEIRARFGTSKKAFKQAVGSLYKQRLITVNPDGIRVAE
jgi:predicted RNA-binding protein (virulence factor B family)